MKSLAAIRALFIYIDSHPDPGNSNGENGKELKEKIRELVVAVEEREWPMLTRTVGCPRTTHENLTDG